MPRLPTRLLRRALRDHVIRLRDPADVREMLDWYSRQRLDLAARLRGHAAGTARLPEILADDGHERLAASVRLERPPWAWAAPSPCDVPGMLSDEERRYYEYVGRFYSGAGAAVELGAWLGCSTFHLIAGLGRNPRFAGRRLAVFDAFVWHAYMEDYHHGGLAPGDSFRPLFERFTAALAPSLRVEAVRFADEPANRHLPALAWRDGPIELCVVDCGRTYDVNDAWYRALGPHFIPDRTLVVMQDWGTHRELPERWYNQTKQFTDSRGEELELVHELAFGTAATFLFRGR
jgi:hypothetical protein